MKYAETVIILVVYFAFVTLVVNSVFIFVINGDVKKLDARITNIEMAKQ